MVTNRNLITGLTLAAVTLFLAPCTAGDQKKSDFAVAPVFTSSPAFGNGLGAVGIYFLPGDEEADGERLPTSTLTAVGMYSDTDSYFLGLFGTWYLNKDTRRVQAGLIDLRTRNRFDIPELGDTRFDTNITGAFVQFQEQLLADTFFGIHVGTFSTRYKEGNEASRLYFEIYDVEDQDSGFFGLNMTYDTRDHERYPSSGALAEPKLSIFLEDLGAERDYFVIDADYNRYIPTTDRSVFAMRVYGRFTPKDTPYVGLSTLGQRSDLRGYVSGEKVANNLAAAQVELRHFFTPRWGAVVFGGVAALWDTGDSIESDQVYGSYGLGIRFRINKEQKLNFRVDYAWVEEDEEGLYVSVREAF